MTTHGERLKAEGQILAQDAVPTWAEQARAVIEMPRGEVGMNRNNAVGAAMSAAARRGLIKRVNFRNSRRPALHAAQLTVWVGTDAVPW